MQGIDLNTQATLTFRQYQEKALRTAKPSALGVDYLVPMIVGEAGELAGKEAKAVRDGWDWDELTEALVPEYGDICWGVAVLAHVVSADPKPAKADVCIAALELAGSMTQTLLDGSQTLAHSVSVMWAALEENCERITGRDFDHVLRYNLEKLADRQARGVLSGSGDNR